MTGASCYVGLACLRCGTPGDKAAIPGLACPDCALEGHAVGFTTVYDLEAARGLFEAEVLSCRPRSVWRYAELLPPVNERVTLGEGGTALVPAPRLAARVGAGSIWIKDESRNPTWSFKDRAASVAASCALTRGSRALVVSSTGNAAAATAAYARRAAIPGILFVAAGVDPLMARFLQAFGAHTFATETKAERSVYMRQLVEEWGCYPNSNFASPPVGNAPEAVDGYKTMAFEIWEQLGCRAPEWIHIPVAYGDGLYGLFKGFSELAELGLAKVPRFGAGEIYGSLARAIAEGLDTVDEAPVDRDTVAFSIGTRQSTYQALAAVRSSEGGVDQVTEAEVMSAQQLLVETEGIFAETASAAGLAALLRQRKRGLVGGDSECVLVNTSTGIKALGVMPEPQEAKVVNDIKVLGQAVEHILGPTIGRGRREHQ